MESEGYPVFAYGLKRIYAFQAARSYPRFISYLRRERVDVVHAYLFAAQMYGVPAARLAGVPLVIAGRRAIGVYWTAPRYRMVRRLTNSLCHLHVGNSLAVKEFIMREEGVPEEKIRIVYNGIDVNRFSPREAGGGSRPPTVGYVGNLTQVKRVDLLLRAARRILPEFPELRVLIAGEGPGEARRSYEGATDMNIRGLTRELGLGARVVFMGRRERVEEDMRQMDIFVMPSQSEGMSNATLEAMGVGLPVIATASGGNCEVVVHGRTGYLFPPGDEARLAELMSELLRDAVARRAMGRAGRERVLERFTLKGMVTAMERVYREGLEGRGGCAL